MHSEQPVHQRSPIGRPSFVGNYLDLPRRVTVVPRRALIGSRLSVDQCSLFGRHVGHGEKTLFPGSLSEWKSSGDQSQHDDGYRHLWDLDHWSPKPVVDEDSCPTT